MWSWAALGRASSRRRRRRHLRGLRRRHPCRHRHRRPRRPSRLGKPPAARGPSPLSSPRSRHRRPSLRRSLTYALSLWRPTVTAATRATRTTKSISASRRSSRRCRRACPASLPSTSAAASCTGSWGCPSRTTLRGWAAARSGIPLHGQTCGCLAPEPAPAPLHHRHRRSRRHRPPFPRRCRRLHRRRASHHRHFRHRRRLRLPRRRLSRRPPPRCPLPCHRAAAMPQPSAAPSTDMIAPIYHPSLPAASRSIGA